MICLQCLIKVEELKGEKNLLFPKINQQFNFFCLKKTRYHARFQKLFSKLKARKKKLQYLSDNIQNLKLQIEAMDTDLVNDEDFLFAMDQSMLCF